MPKSSNKSAQRGGSLLTREFSSDATDVASMSQEVDRIARGIQEREGTSRDIEESMDFIQEDMFSVNSFMKDSVTELGRGNRDAAMEDVLDAYNASYRARNAWLSVADMVYNRDITYSRDYRTISSNLDLMEDRIQGMRRQIQRTEQQ
jgi:hypothetical protein